jgi:AraC-like DNA-binding protein
MDNSVISFLNVEVIVTAHHRWAPGYSTFIPAVLNSNLYNLWLVLDGHVRVISEERSWDVKANNAFIMPVGMQREIIVDEGAQLFSVGLRTTMFNLLDLMQPLDLPVLWTPEAHERKVLEVQMSELIRLSGNGETAAALARSGFAAAVLGLCWDKLTRNDLAETAHHNFPQWLVTVLRRIREEPGVSIQQLAKETGFSPAQFRRSFHDWVGVPPRDYVKSRRLEMARRLLETTDLPVQTVATRIGFSSTAHLSRLFAQVYGQSPSAVRNQARTMRF